MLLLLLFTILFAPFANCHIITLFCWPHVTSIKSYVLWGSRVNREFIQNIIRRFWPFWDGENVTRTQGLLVTSNVWGWKGHGLNHLDCITMIFLKQFLSGSKGPEDVFGSFQRCPPHGWDLPHAYQWQVQPLPTQNKKNNIQIWHGENKKHTATFVVELKTQISLSFSWLQ